jgi:hypothetical protein
MRSEVWSEKWQTIRSHPWFDFFHQFYCNDQKYVLLVMNHKEKCRLMIRPHEAHLDILNQPPHILVGSGSHYKETKLVRNGVQHLVNIPADATAILIWDRVK